MGKTGFGSSIPHNLHLKFNGNQRLKSEVNNGKIYLLFVVGCDSLATKKVTAYCKNLLGRKSRRHKCQKGYPYIVTKPQSIWFNYVLIEVSVYPKSTGCSYILFMLFIVTDCVGKGELLAFYFDLNFSQ